MECWTDLEHPTGETQMAFAGRKDERDRQDVIAYLKNFPE
jgi:cytochrome c2